MSILGQLLEHAQLKHLGEQGVVNGWQFFAAFTRIVTVEDTEQVFTATCLQEMPQAFECTEAPVVRVLDVTLLEVTEVTTSLARPRVNTLT